LLSIAGTSGKPAEATVKRSAVHIAWILGLSLATWIVFEVNNMRLSGSANVVVVVFWIIVVSAFAAIRSWIKSLKKSKVKRS
jgi:hypothetical protein